MYKPHRRATDPEHTPTIASTRRVDRLAALLIGRKAQYEFERRNIDNLIDEWGGLMKRAATAVT